MRYAVITIIVLAVTSLIAWVRGGESFHLAKAFPFLGGYDPGIYDVGSLIIVVITTVGLARLAERGKDDD
jgi:hypothetical protein